MKCKYCQAELEANSSVCPACGKDNLKDNLKGLKITALVLVCVVMVVLLAGLICYGITGSFIPNFGGDATDPSGSGSTTHQVSTADGVVTMTEKELSAQMDKVVATMGKHKLTNRELQIYYWMAAYNYGEGADLTKPLSQQIYDKTTGQTYEQYFLEEAVKFWQEMMLMHDAAEDADYELPEEYQKNLDSLEEQLDYYAYMYAYYYGLPLEDADDYVKLQFGPGCDFDTYYDYNCRYYLGGLYWSEMLLELEVTDAEIEAYFTENETALAENYAIPVTKDFGNLVDVRVLTINPITEKVTDAEGKETTVENWDATLKAMQEVYDEYMAGEMTEEAFIALVKEHSDDTATVSGGGLYSDLYVGSLAEVDVRHILIMPESSKDEDGKTVYTDEAWADAYAEAEAILNEWLAGDKTEDSFAALANEHSDDNNGNVTNGGLYTDIYVGQMVKNFEAWCFDESRQVGDYGIVKTEYGYHIMYFVHADRDADTWAFDESRQVGDVTFVKTDTDYVMLYYVGAEPAWLRYSRYGAQAEKAAAMMDVLVEKNPYTLDEDKVVLAELD